jgi:hypothetical protein
MLHDSFGIPNGFRRSRPGLVLRYSCGSVIFPLPLRYRLAKLDLVADNYRAQPAEGMISMAKLREKLDAVAEERGGWRRGSRCSRTGRST